LYELYNNNGILIEVYDSLLRNYKTLEVWRNIASFTSWFHIFLETYNQFYKILIKNVYSRRIYNLSINCWFIDRLVHVQNIKQYGTSVMRCFTKMHLMMHSVRTQNDFHENNNVSLTDGTPFFSTSLAHLVWQLFSAFNSQNFPRER